MEVPLHISDILLHTDWKQHCRGELRTSSIPWIQEIGNDILQDIENSSRTLRDGPCHASASHSYLLACPSWARALRDCSPKRLDCLPDHGSHSLVPTFRHSPLHHLLKERLYLQACWVLNQVRGCLHVHQRFRNMVERQATLPLHAMDRLYDSRRRNVPILLWSRSLLLCYLLGHQSQRYRFHSNRRKRKQAWLTLWLTSSLL